MTDMKIYKGSGGTSGLAVGQAFNLYSSFQNIPRRYLQDKNCAEKEINRLNEAKEQVFNEIHESEQKSTLFLGEELRKMFETHKLILNDPQILPKAEQIINEKLINTEWALLLVIDKIKSEFQKIQNNYIKSRFNDIRQVLERVMDFLLLKNDAPMLSFNSPVILIKEDISPTELTSIISKNVVGVATEYGGEKTHTAIMCQSLGIPLVVGLQGIVGKIPDFEAVVLDTEQNEIISQPDEATLDKKYKRISLLTEREKRLKSEHRKPCQLKDGYPVKLEANIDFINEAYKVSEYDIDGVGLLRSEILFMTHKTPPTTDEQYDMYHRIFAIVKNKPVTIRTWDLGADKSTDFFPAIHHEVNPALGLRAIRLCIREIEFFKIQLRALVKLSKDFNIRILLPMITNITEINTTRKLITEIAEEIGIPAGGVKLGAMIETPAAAINIEEILRHVDFVSIGTNDLVQYTLGIDRGNEYLSYLYSPYHPAVIKTLDQVIKAANFFNKEVVVCGEISSDPVMQLILLGMGQVVLSMNTEMVLMSRKFLSFFSLNDCKKIAFQFLTFKNRDECLGLQKKLISRYRGEITEKI